MTQPKDPFGGVGDMAITSHEIFTSYVKAGFTRGEALQIIIAITTATLNQPPPPLKEDDK